MALKTVQVSDVPSLDQVPESSTALLSTSRLPLKVAESVKASFKPSKFLLVGHRGKGMNALASPDRRLQAVKENTVLSFNEASRFPVDFVEFDVQRGISGRPGGKWCLDFGIWTTTLHAFSDDAIGGRRRCAHHR